MAKPAESAAWRCARRVSQDIPILDSAEAHMAGCFAAIIAEEYAPLVEALRWIAYTAGQAYHAQGGEVVAREMERSARAALGSEGGKK